LKIIGESGSQRRRSFSGLVEFSALVVGADDEDAHVASGRGLDGRPVEIVDEIPVEVDVVELACLNRPQDSPPRAVRGETDKARPPLALQLTRGVERAALGKCPLEDPGVVDAVEREHVDVIEPEVFH